MFTFQDFEKIADKTEAVGRVISDHLLGPAFSIAKKADLYDRQLNETINNYVRMIFSLTGTPIEDFTASNNKLASNFFHRLNTQRCTYLLGNGVSFSEHIEEGESDNGVKITKDTTKERLGNKFDTDLKHLAYKALIHGVSFGFWNVDRLYVFPLTEFAPLWDEETGILRAGVRFWKLAMDKPVVAVLYEEDGYTKYRSRSRDSYDFEIIQPKKSYKLKIEHTEATGDIVVGGENYGPLPIIPLWGSSLKQSTLIGMQQKIDSYDLIRSGFANDLTDCAQIYWIIENCGGMSDSDLARFRDRLKLNHIAEVDGDTGAKATPFTQEIPFDARKTYLDDLRAGIYEDFGGLDVHTVEAGATNDHIDAAYQPMDEEADDFEYQVCEFIQQLLSLMGIEDTPVFKRNRISNELEQTQMIMLVADYLDDETILKKLPFISVDEIETILKNKAKEDTSKFEPEEREAEDNPFGQNKPEEEEPEEQ